MKLKERTGNYAVYHSVHPLTISDCQELFDLGKYVFINQTTIEEYGVPWNQVFLFRKLAVLEWPEEINLV